MRYSLQTTFLVVAVFAVLVSACTCIATFSEFHAAKDRTTSALFIRYKSLDGDPQGKRIRSTVAKFPYGDRSSIILAFVGVTKNSTGETLLWTDWIAYKHQPQKVQVTLKDNSKILKRIDNPRWDNGVYYNFTWGLADLGIEEYSSVKHVSLIVGDMVTNHAAPVWIEHRVRPDGGQQYVEPKCRASGSGVDDLITALG